MHRCFAGVSIEYLQTPAKALDRDSIGEDVQLKLYLSSELFGKLLCQPIRVPLESTETILPTPSIVED